MKLYLTSLACDSIDKIDFKNRKKVAFIATAADLYKKKDFVENDRNAFRSKGLEIMDFDIKRYSKRELYQKLINFDVIFFSGGNAHYLLKKMKQTGFDQIVGGLLDEGVIYIGSSAGSYVACPNIDMAFWKSKHEHYGLTDFKAMHLVNFLVVAHYDEVWKKVIKKNLPNSKYPIKLLKDEQALLIEDDNIKFIGVGKEEIIN